MSFPSNPFNGDSHTIGSRTWYWDGNTWNLLPGATTNSTVPGGEQPDHTHDTPKILDDLLDVEIEEPE